MGLRRSSTEPDAWEIYVSVRNYGRSAQQAAIGLQFAGSPAGSKTLTLKPESEQETTFLYRTRAAGIVEAKLLTGDAFPQDDRAVLELPQQKQLRIGVFTNEPELLRAVLNSNPNMTATFLAPAAFNAETVDFDIVVLDRFAPPQRPKADSIWIDPPAAQSPVQVAATRTNAKLTRWTDDVLLGAGLHTKEVEIESLTTYRAAPGDVVIAESDGAAVIVARPSKPKVAVLGLHPFKTRMRYELASPLLLANTIRWMAPDSFRRWQISGGHVGTVNVTTEGKINPEAVRVLNEDGTAIPFTAGENQVRFFAGAPGTIRVITGDRDYVYSLTVPEVGEAVWEVPSGVRRGIPRRSGGGPTSTDLWYWLALAGLAVLLAEWLIYGRHRVQLRTASPPSSSSPGRDQDLAPQRKAS
jgi:hypothetical protein